MSTDRYTDLPTNDFFLLLPELRNHVYNYLLEHIQASPGTIEYYEASTSKCDGLADLTAMSQVSHQIRGELLSLLVKSRTIRVHLRLIPAFMNSQLCHLVFDREISPEVPITIEIPMDRLKHSVTSMDADVTKFLVLVLNTPRIRLIFSGTWDQPQSQLTSQRVIGIQGPEHLREVDAIESRLHDLNRVFSFKNREEWRNALDTSIARVELSETLRRGRYYAFVFIFLRKDAPMPPLQDLGLLWSSSDKPRHYPYLKVFNEKGDSVPLDAVDDE
ncbi:hypothetical protein BKA66DRAFT_570168 [Pyrenochaeta sp. MPI-SDFR-AT-0127]|nr:hypothetical protein BKA66DRAFT_570168 [Pyrenochaeta sp. MPI-SDFR-AT-0127]